MSYSKLNSYKDDIIKLYKDKKKTLQEIADIYETCPSSILNFLKRYGVVLRKTGRAPRYALDEYKDEIINLYVNKLYTINKISRKYQMSESTVRMFLVRHGIERREGGSLKKYFLDDLKDEIVKMYVEEGFTIVDICKRYKSSYDSIRKVLKDNNIVLRRGGIPKNLNKLLPHKDKILSMYNTDVSIGFISKKYGVSRASVRLFIKNNDPKSDLD